MPCRSLRIATFLAPNLLPLYAFVARVIADRLSLAVEFVVGSSYRQLYDQADLAFICGLAYIELERDVDLEPLAAPLLQGQRYAGKPIYFSDVIVRRDSPFRSFADMRGCSWAYNEPYSHSGYGVIRHHLLRLGETNGYFGRVVEAGFHERSIRLVAAGAVDASAIDSQVLAVALRDQPELADQLRVIETLGPSTIQPVVAARRLDRSLRADLRATLLEVADEPGADEVLGRGLVERFVAVEERDYDDVGAMRDACAAANFATLR
jgi:phosphate/phosphite/phosphonate ABC transporter binding protein